MIVFGGIKAAATLINTGGQFDPVANSWTATTTTGAPAIRYGHNAVWTGSKMVVFGGANTVNAMNTGGQYDPVANTWTVTSTTGAPLYRYYHAGTWTGSKMLVFGGTAIREWDLSPV